LTASNINKTGGVLNWTGAVDEIGVVGYKIYSLTENTYSEIAYVNDVHSYNLISLNSDTSYILILKAVDVAGNWSEYSPMVTLHTDKNLPIVSVGGGSIIPPSTSNQGSIFVELNLDADTEVTKEVSQDGQSFTKVSVDMGKLTQLLTDSPQLEHIVIPVVGVDPTVKVVLPLNAIPDDRLNIVIEVKTNDASYKLPTRLLKEFPKKNTVTISIRKVSNEENNDITEIIQKKGSQPLIDRAIEFTLDLDGQEITDFHNIYVDRTITVHSTVDPNKVTAVWIDSNKKVQFIPSTITNSDGVANVIIHSTHNSKYSIIQSQSSFTDMQGHWAKQDVELMANKYIVDGVSDSNFAPEQLITRAEFAAILVRSLGLVEAKPKDNLMDVKVTDWYSGAINTANKMGLISGFEDGTFHPNTTITREQMVTMIARSLNLVGKEVQVNLSLLSQFEDQSEIAEWAKNAVAITVAAKITQGKSGLSFEAKGNTTRAEAVTLLKRMLVYVDFIN
jgi:hypothetical protein